MICNLCPRQCNTERNENSNLNGFCRMPLLPKIARADLHFWEEPVISGKNGSGTVFFSGCSLSCVYCQNYDISHKGNGKVIDYNGLAEIFYNLEKNGAHNINLVNPTHYAITIKDALDIYRPKIPIVYNSSGYDNVSTLKMLEGYIDIYLTDFKYMSSDKALLYSGAENYPEIAKKALLECYRQQPIAVINTDGIMQKGVIIRHLLLPQATKEAILVFDWIRNNTPGVYLSLMNQYIPCGDAENFPTINRKVTPREYNKVLDYIFEFDFQNIFVQDTSSADKKFIPDFNLKE